jgi:protein-L-isoaspartate(D-aspartate) O-methyltransferase
VALEEEPDLVDFARATLAGYANVTVVAGRLTAAAAGHAPFDVILFNGAVETLPETFSAALADGGRLVVVEGRGHAARAMLYRALDGRLSGQSLFNAALPLLPGFARTREFSL